MSYAYTNGNRLPLPPGLPSRHFLYKTRPQKLRAADVREVVSETKQKLAANPLRPSEVHVVQRGGLHESATAFDRLIDTLPGKHLFAERRPMLLACEQAVAHCDPDYEGSSFLSIVLHTGPEPYYLQLFHSTVTGTPGTFTLEESSRMLRAGDWFIFDPTTPHLVIPRRPNRRCLLILLQVELLDRTEAERRAILEAFPVLANDADAEYMAVA